MVTHLGSGHLQVFRVVDLGSCESDRDSLLSHPHLRVSNLVYYGEPFKPKGCKKVRTEIGCRGMKLLVL